MEITPYNSDESKKEQVREMFDAIAPKYDLLNHVLSMNVDRSWRRKLVRMVAQQKPCSLLDVATGTADLAILLSRQMPSVKVSGTDLSPQMVAHGRTKIAKRGLDIDLTVADAEHLPYSDGQFDAVTAAFGVRNFENTVAGLREMGRVLRPAGRLYILEFSTPRRSIFAAVFKFYFRHILPAIGRLVSRDARAYTYLPESVEAFASGQKFLDLLHEAGFTETHARPLTFGIATIYTATK